MVGVRPNKFVRNLHLKPMSYHLEKRARMEGRSADEIQRKSPSPEEIDLSTQSFTEIVDFPTFVDKTLFIKAFLKKGDKVIVALAPRRFGKSTNMDMVKEFLTGNKKLFQDNELKIWKEEMVFFDKYCQENPVIYVDFKDVSGRTIDRLFESLKDLIFFAFNEHQYLIKEIDGKICWSDPKLKVVGRIEVYEKYWKNPENLSEQDVVTGLKKLSHCLHVYHEKPVYVLIDEYDSPVMKIIVNKTNSTNEVLLNEAIDTISDLMSTTFKNNKHIKKGLINACVRIAEVLSGDANNIQYYGFLRKPLFSSYFGFTDTEVNSLLEKEEFTPFNNDQVKEWYNGYKFTDSEDHSIYSCYSVLQYLTASKEKNKPCFANYWVDSGSIAYLKELFGQSKIRKFIEDLIDGDEIKIKAILKFAKEDIIALQELLHQKLSSVSTEQAHLFIQFLAENGYLNVVSTSTVNETITVRIPNQEIRILLKGKLYNVELFRTKYHLSNENIDNYWAALKSVLTEDDKNAFIKYAKAVFQLFDGAKMPQCEAEFQSILFVLAYNIKDYIAHSEVSVSRTKPKGRPPRLDLLMVLNNAGLIVELKFDDKSSEEAHSQIINRQYVAAFDDYKNVTKKILMGLYMNKEGKVSLTYTINDSSPDTVTNDSPIE